MLRSVQVLPQHAREAPLLVGGPLHGDVWSAGPQLSVTHFCSTLLHVVPVGQTVVLVQNPVPPSPARHWPAEQRLPTGQRWPQPPQFSGSVW